MTNQLNLLNQLQLGDIVGDTKRMVIACTKIQDYTPGDSLAVWVAICAKDGEYHPYVVWDVAATKSGWHCANGNYCFTLAESLNYYHERGGKDGK
jgi:hypothetical protein